MIKQTITAVLLSLCFLLCGCGKSKAAPRLTVDEYKTQLGVVWDKYVKAETTAASYLVEGAQINGSEVKLSLGTIMKNASEAAKQYDIKEEALDEFAALNPPKEYDALQKKLSEAAKDERGHTDLQRALFAAKTEDELAAADAKIAEYNASHTGGGVPEAYTNIILELRKK